REEKRQSATSLIREKASGEETKEKTPQSDSEEKIKTQKVKPLHSEQRTLRERDEKTPTSVRVEEREVSGKTSKAVWGSIALLFVLVLYAIFGAPESTAELETDVADLKTRVRGLQNELANTNEFIGDHISLIEFINNKNIDIINFLSPEAEVNYWGRLFISFDAGEALLQVNSIPSLNQDEVYQVWLVTKDAAFSLGALFINPDENYYKISGIPYVPKEMISLFRITIEKAPSAETPLGKTFLYGVINNNALSPRK
ncbi:MAG: anti-sigma factor, partial [Bacteroidetes bacterium]|nr:anti-sigma factor [Bacteroidota bacterium]